MTETNAAPVLEKGDKAPLRLRMGEVGQTGLITLGGQVGLDTDRWELQWPHCINTFSKMKDNAVIAPALALIEMQIAKVPWKVKIKREFSSEAKARAKFLEQCMSDMDHSWFSFIRELASFNTYGFSLHEIVLRLRRNRNGSKFNDGLVGIQKLPIRSQETIFKWNYDDNFRELLSIEQLTYQNSSSSALTGVLKANQTKTIPRNKFLLFRNATRKDSPLGRSPLMGAWEAWKYMTAIQEFEAVGIATDARGLKVLYIPPEYMSEDADDKDKAVFQYYKEVMNNLHKQEQSGLILPQVVDPDSREQYFKLELLGVQGQRTVDPNIVIERYSKEILTCLFADSLQLGQKAGGSYSLADSKSSVVAMYVESKLMEIQDQLNHHLVRLLWEANGWPLDEVPELVYGEIAVKDLDVFSKFVQRISATGYLPKNIEVLNKILEQIDIEAYPEDTNIEELNLPEDTSRSGDGMKVGTTGNGTAKGVSKDDNSVSNSENA
jgi:hypothetical protein